jgi:hypothetical protein
LRSILLPECSAALHSSRASSSPEILP